MKRLTLMAKSVLIVAVLLTVICWMRPRIRETEKTYWENWSTWAKLRSMGRVVVDFWEYADPKEADALIKVESLAELWPLLEKKTIGGFPAMAPSLETDFERDGWSRPFELERTTTETGVRLRVLSAGADGVFDSGQGDDLYLDLLFRDHKIVGGMSKQSPDSQAIPWILGDIAAGSNLVPR